MARGQPVAKEVLFHGETGAQEADDGVAGGLDDLGRRIGNVQEGNAHLALDGGRHLVQRVGAQRDAVGSGQFERARGVGEVVADGAPVLRPHQQLHLVEVDAVEQQLGGVQAP